MPETESIDVLVVGAGLSGIGAAVHLQRDCPDRRFAIVEARQALGGTWDLFRYPGVRSDSDMYTLGYSFKPWTGAKAIADGPSILAYLRETAREHGIDQRIRYGHRVKSAAWSSQDAEWTVEIERDKGDKGDDLPEATRIRCKFLMLCSGYYDYAAGYIPEFEGRERFAGRIVHPQHWPGDLDVSGKRVVVIGSGATAVTLVPELAKTAAHVTMLQRSPTYMIARPSLDRAGGWLVRRFGGAGAGIARWKNVGLGMLIFRLARRRPQKARAAMLGMIRKALGPSYAQSDLETHFTPRYNPWEQRLCLVPDGDLFKAMRGGRASIVTDKIARFTEGGMVLESGAELPADVIVTATGLALKVGGGAALDVDGRALASSQLVNYKGVMFEGVPNLVSVFGYAHLSWTLKADLASAFMCRVLNDMRRTGARQCVPRMSDTEWAAALAPWVDFSSGYFERAAAILPRQGQAKPWKLNQSYLADWMTLRRGRLDDGVLQFSK